MNWLFGSSKSAPAGEENDKDKENNPLKPMEKSKPMMENKNVAGGRLAMHSDKPPTGFYRDGYCRTGPEDKSNHSVAGTVTKEFLDFSTSKGNNLRDAGVKDGMKWCLCASRWKEAYDAYKKGDLSKAGVPNVTLHACDESALKTVSYKELSSFAAEGEAPTQMGRQETHVNPGGRTGSMVKNV